MVHGDDNGLVLPPNVAPIQVVIVPIRQDAPGVLDKCREIEAKLNELGIRVKLDDSDHTPGWKFAQWEMKGVPLRLELGPRDLESDSVCLVKRVNGEKKVASIPEIEASIPSLLQEIHKDMYEKAKAHLDANVTEVRDPEHLISVLNVGGYAKMMWCGDAACEAKVKEITNGGTARCMPFDEKPFADTCPICGKKADKVVYFAKAY
jgi:prolyl-tRNA synthetase